MPDYINPFSALPNINQGGPRAPFDSFLEGERFQQAQPFIQRAGQAQEMDLNEKAQKLREFMSPSGMQSREVERQHGIDTKQSEMRVLPFKEQYDITKYEQDKKSYPILNDEKVAKANETIKAAKSAPQREFLQSLGNAYPYIDQAKGDAAKSLIWKGIVKQIKDLHPEYNISPRFENYSPEVMGDIAAFHYGQINTPGQKGKEQITEMEGKNKLEVRKLANQGEVDAAHQHRLGQENAAETRASVERPENFQTALRRLHRDINEAKTNEDRMLAEQELLSTLDAHKVGILAHRASDPEAKMAATLNDQPRLQRAYARIEQEVRATHGLSPKNSASASGGLPPEARAQLKEGQQTTFRNGQSWTLVNGQPQRLK